MRTPKPQFSLKVIGDGKQIALVGFDHLAIDIDYDDVDHPDVWKEAQKLVKLLNQEWGRME